MRNEECLLIFFLSRFLRVLQLEVNNCGVGVIATGNRERLYDLSREELEAADANLLPLVRVFLCVIVMEALSL